MPRRLRGNFSKRQALSHNAQLWLRGDRNCGFFKFKHQDELETLWNAYGDHDKFHWEPGMRLPEALAAGYSRLNRGPKAAHRNVGSRVVASVNQQGHGKYH